MAGPQKALFVPKSFCFTAADENHEVPDKAKTQRLITRTSLVLARRLGVFAWAIRPKVSACGQMHLQKADANSGASTVRRTISGRRYPACNRIMEYSLGSGHSNYA